MKIMIKMNKRNILFLALIIFNMLWMGYIIIDYLSLSHDDSNQNNTYLHEDLTQTFFPGDGKITGWEDMTFGMVCPMISALMFIELLKGMSKIESNKN